MSDPKATGEKTVRNDGQSRFTNQRGWRFAVAAAVVAWTIGACRTPTPEDVLGSRTAPEDDWFCNASADGQWECVQDQALAANPDLRKDRPVSEDRPVTTSVRVEPEPVDGQPVLGWPARHYAVQLIALESEQAVSGLADHLAIPELLRVRVDSGGRLFHVLLAGPYADRLDAEVAGARLVRRMPSLEPWVRSVGTLQAAVRRAQQARED